MSRCSGITRKGTRCTITSASEMIDNSGRLVALPLRRGGEFCAIHAKPFVVRPTRPETSLVVVYLDLETTGVDVAQDRIVEIAALHAPADHRLAGGSYSSTICVDPQILKERGAEAAERSRMNHYSDLSYAAAMPRFPSLYTWSAAAPMGS